MLPLAFLGPLIGAVASLFVAKKERDRQKNLEAEQRSYEDELRAEEEKKQGAISQVNTVFDDPSREAGYNRYLEAIRGIYGDELGRQKTDQARNLKFALARSGLYGGSVDVDSRKRLGDEFARATLQSERSAQSDLTRLRDRDEASRENLIALIRAGANPGETVNRGNSLLTSNLSSALAAGPVQGLGDIFGQTAETYRRINERAAQRRGLGYTATREDIYGRGRAA